MSVLKFYVPEWWESWTTETIVDNILQQIEGNKLLDHLISIQRYREHVEIFVKKQYATKFLEMKINVDGVFFFFVAKEENVLVINIYGLELDTDWTNVVHAMSKFGSPIHYYELKRNWSGKTIKTGVRCIWIKNINVVPPDIIKQGDRQITFKETVTLRNCQNNETDETRLKPKVAELEKEGEIREAEIFCIDENDKKLERASHALLKIANSNASPDGARGEIGKITEAHLDVTDLPESMKLYPKKERLPTPNPSSVTSLISGNYPHMTSTISNAGVIPPPPSIPTIPIGILKTDKVAKYAVVQKEENNALKGHV